MTNFVCKNRGSVGQKGWVIRKAKSATKISSYANADRLLDVNGNVLVDLLTSALHTL